MVWSIGLSKLAPSSEMALLLLFRELAESRFCELSSIFSTCEELKIPRAAELAP